MDMAMAPDSYRAFIENLTELVEEGVVSMERIDDAVLRILRVKAAIGPARQRPQRSDDRPRGAHAEDRLRRAPRHRSRGGAQVARAAEEQRRAAARKAR